MAEEALKFWFNWIIGIIYAIFAAGFIGFLIPAAYYTAQSNSFSLLWIGSFVFLGLAGVFSLILFICTR
jgi:phosphotransferase system  glucose/maltose/N-acetylglucosamine-specific IIC component